MVPALCFTHLAAMTTDIGLFEHARYTAPRPEEGYCLDDVARALVVTSREPEPSPAVRRLSSIYLDFTCSAQDAEGRFHNRRMQTGPWADQAGLDDHWGRALWGLGTAAAAGVDDGTRALALAHASTAMRCRSPWLRAMAYAAVGSFEILRAEPGHPDALHLLADARAMLSRHDTDPSWPWPQTRLTYANAVLPEALMVIGAGLGDDEAVDRGLRLLTWLLELQTRDDRLSVIAVGGWQLGEPRARFAQQPIEVAALAEACSRALEATGDAVWQRAIEQCAGWFLGANDAGIPLYDAATGGGFDGLEATGINQNQGAESTLAALSTLQLARRVEARAVR
jgi:hypothetical protein